MHEIAVASGILDRALDAAAEADADGIERIETLTLEIGRATHVNPRQLQFCLETIAEGTIAEGATIETRTIEPELDCSCGFRGEPETLDVTIAVAPNLRCPDCGEPTTLVRGRECRLASIEIPESTPPSELPSE